MSKQGVPTTVWWVVWVLVFRITAFHQWTPQEGADVRRDVDDGSVDAGWDLFGGGKEKYNERKKERKGSKGSVSKWWTFLWLVFIGAPSGLPC